MKSCCACKTAQDARRQRTSEKVSPFGAKVEKKPGKKHAEKDKKLQNETFIEKSVKRQNFLLTLHFIPLCKNEQKKKKLKP